MVDAGAARFTLDATQQRARQGQLFVLEPEAVHTGMAAVPEGWSYKVLYIDPGLLARWAERDLPAPRASRWVVFEDVALRMALLRVHDALVAEPPGLGIDEPVLYALDALRPHLRPGPARRGHDRPEHAAVRRARRHLRDRWDQRVALAELATVAGLSRFELVRCFRLGTGLTPHAYQVNLRIGRARELLAAGVAPAQVAAQCGFCDQPHLTRAFRRAVGVTPARYARAAPA
jgi:AraC-like DNA-binding protein